MAFIFCRSLTDTQSMSFLFRSARTLAATRPARHVRLYASETVGVIGDKIKLDFVVPHESIYKAVSVQQVNLAATSGDMGILANHVPSIEQLKPGVVEVVENASTSKKFFVSGGFATISADSSLQINAVEAFPLENFSIEAVKSGLADAQHIVNGSGSEAEKATAKVEIEVYEALQTALAK